MLGMVSTRTQPATLRAIHSADACEWENARKEPSSPARRRQRKLVAVPDSAPVAHQWRGRLPWCNSPSVDNVIAKSPPEVVAYSILGSCELKVRDFKMPFSPVPNSLQL